MPRYFMSDTRLGWLEKMMMDPSRPSPPRITPRQKTPQKKLPCNRPASSAIRVPKGKGGGV